MYYDRRNLQGGAHLSAYDPATGKVTATRSFPAGSQLPINGYVSGYTLRQQFNADFSAMTAEGPVGADGSTSAGITDENGRYQALTAGTSAGYGSPAVKAPISFNSATGRLWYSYGDAAGGSLVGSVDPHVGASSDRHEVLVSSKYDNGPFSFPAGNNVKGYFAADGFGPIAISNDVFLPGGTQAAEGQYSQTQTGFHIGKEGKLSDKDPYLPVTSAVGVPILPVSKNSFVAFDDSPDNHTQLYLCTIGDTEIKAAPLLPPSNRVIQDIALDPTGSKLAFVSTAGVVTTLYTVDITGSKQLKNVSEVPVPSGEAVTFQVLAWH